VFNPPSVLGKPTAGACATDNDCAVFSSIATCNKTAGDRYVGYCQLTYHQKMTDDSQCVTCHGEGSAIADVTKVHAIAQWQSPITLDGYKFTGVTVTGGSAAGGAFQVGDQPVLTFKLLDASGNAVTTLISDASWAGRFAISGPTSNPQRVIGTSSSAYNMKTQGTLTVDGTGTYTYTPPQTWPAQSLGAIGSFPAGGIQTNPTGSYTAFFYWNRSATPTTAYPAGPATVGDAVDAKTVVSFVVGGATAQPPQARQVVTQAACGSCHGQAADGFPHFAWHGSNARKDVEACSICHTENATSAPGVTTPPGPPEYSVDYQKMVHQIHLARLLDTPPAGALAEFAEVLSPVDVRSCNNCHGDSLVACKVATDCGYGQSCGANGKCQNTAFLNPTARACISCHNGADAQSHAAAMTSNGVETCTVCHGQGTQFAVDVMHNITTDFLVNLPYSREAP
jgi:OmcA/MtrC family decaheme c-type cytochrome